MAYKVMGSAARYLVKMMGSRATAAKWMNIEEFEDPQIVLNYRLAVGLDQVAEPVTRVETKRGSDEPKESAGGRESKAPEGNKESKDGNEGNDGKERKVDQSEGEGALPEQEDDDDSWRRPSCAIAASMANTTQIVPYVYDPDSKEAPEWLSIVPAPGAGGGSRISDLLAATHAELLISKYILYRSQPMIIPMSSFFRTSGTVRLPRLTSNRAPLPTSAGKHLLMVQATWQSVRTMDAQGSRPP